MQQRIVILSGEGGELLVLDVCRIGRACGLRIIRGDGRVYETCETAEGEYVEGLIGDLYSAATKAARCVPGGMFGWKLQGYTEGEPNEASEG